MHRPDRWIVYYRPDRREEAGSDTRVVYANRVEGWNKDYAFFGHPTRSDQLTLLIPRELVSEVNWDDWTDVDQKNWQELGLQVVDGQPS